jgi:hypothetical protein
LNENWIKYWVHLGQLDKEYFLKYFWAFLHGFEGKLRQGSCIKCQRDYWWNDGTKFAWQWWMETRVPTNGSRYWQWTCMEIIMCMWNARMTRWLEWEITWSRDHDIRTCQGRGVAYCMPITFSVPSRSISVNDLAHTLSTFCEVLCGAKRSHKRHVLRICTDTERHS